MNQIIKGGISSSINIKRIPLPIKVYSISIKEYNIYEYIIILIYILGPNSIVLIRREVYIIDDLSTKALIGIDIIKPKGIILDISKDLITIGSYNLL